MKIPNVLDPSARTIVLVHGWTGCPDDEDEAVKDILFEDDDLEENLQVIVLDWSYGSHYGQWMRPVFLVFKFFSKFSNFLTP